MWDLIIIAVCLFVFFKEDIEKNIKTFEEKQKMEIQLLEKQLKEKERCNGD